MTNYIHPDVPIYLIDPNEPELNGFSDKVTFLQMNAAKGMPLLVEQLVKKYVS